MGFDLVDVDGGGVESTTPKAMQLATMVREVPGRKEVISEEVIVPGFYRSETRFLLSRLQDVASPCLHVWGTKTDIAHAEGYRDYVVSQTGNGKFGNGGVTKGGVEEAWVEDVNYLIPSENPKDAAEVIALWLLKEVESWRREEKREEDWRRWVVVG